MRDTLIAIVREMESLGNGNLSVSTNDPDSNTFGISGDLIYSESTNSIWVFLEENWVKVLGNDGADGADGATGATGDTGDTVIVGIVYYGTLQSNRPSTPNASSWNLVTSTFTGLTANWSTNQPPVDITDTAVREWSSDFSVTIDGATGNQIISFATPVGAIQVTDNIESDNYTPGVSGWAIRRDDGYAEFGSAAIRGQLTSDQIAANAITASKINVGSLDAISATIGTFSSATSGARLVLEDDVIKVYDASNVLRVQIGNLTV